MDETIGHMDDAGGSHWVRAVILVGVTYALIGVVFAWPTSHVHGWRLAAWVASAIAYAGHIGFERFVLHTPPRRSAVHVASAVALGAFGLAAAANLHSLSVVSTTQQRHLLLLALAAWPILTGLPAFLVALVTSAVLARLRPNPRGQ